MEILTMMTFNVLVVGKMVFFQILEQDEYVLKWLRKKSLTTPELFYNLSDGETYSIYLQSESCPELNHTTIFVRGSSTSSDYLMTAIDFDTDSDAKIYGAILKEIIDETLEVMHEDYLNGLYL